MTPKQEERIRAKISKIKSALAADKKHWGGYYHDGQGFRYALPRLYIQLGDYAGGLRYLNWFYKNFPDDAGYPDFLFEFTIILFKTGRRKEAEKKAFETFTRNTYLFDKFFNRPVTPIEKWEGSNLEVAAFATDYFDYSYKQVSLADFAEWLNTFTKTEKFVQLASQYIEIYKALKSEHDTRKRGSLIKQAAQLKKDY